MLAQVFVWMYSAGTCCEHSANKKHTKFNFLYCKGNGIAVIIKVINSQLTCAFNLWIWCRWSVKYLKFLKFWLHILHVCISLLWTSLLWRCKTSRLVNVTLQTSHSNVNWLWFWFMWRVKCFLCLYLLPHSTHVNIDSIVTVQSQISQINVTSKLYIPLAEHTQSMTS